MAKPTEVEMEQAERYFAGELGEDETVQLRRWFMANPEPARVLELVTRELDATEGLGETGRSEALASWQRVMSRYEQSLGATSGAQPTHARRVRRAERGLFQRHPLSTAIGFVGTMALAAAVILVAWGAVTGRVGERRAPAMMTYVTGNGERATITLPDSSTVALNVASRLDVPVDYLTGNRTVRLVGEGLFTVLHHRGAPLTVLAGPTATRVLGTSFVVRRYRTDTVTVVAVRDGKVATGSATVVSAHQMIVVGRSKSPRVRPWDPSAFTFATGVLTIDGLSLPAAVAELDRWFDADIRLGDSTLATHAVKGSFAQGSLGDLAEILELTFDVRVVRDGRVLTLYPKR